MGTQRNELLSGQIIVIQEGEYAHGCSTAPAGEAYKNGVVAGDIVHKAFDFGTGIGLEFLTFFVVRILRLCPCAAPRISLHANVQRI